MPVVSGAEFLKAARQGGYAVGGFNTNNLEWTQAILKAAEAKKAPVLIKLQWVLPNIWADTKLLKTSLQTWLIQ